jgi:hypothetical protein
MKTYRSGHGPIAVMNQEERGVLEKARDLLEEARKIESDNGELHMRNYPEVAAAEAAVEVVILYQIHLIADNKIQREAK